ncbi:MAG: RluA family pseudouridine synthase, partial [Ilumatobacter sp.]
MIVEEVPAALDGQRLDRIVALIGDISRSDASSTISDGGVKVDGLAVSSGKIRLVEGQRIEIDPAMFPVIELPGPDADVEFGVVHEDEHVIVVDKPPGLVVHPGAGNKLGTLANGLLHRFPDIEDVGDRMRPGIVHRLDAGSSGLLVVARTQEAADRLIAQFADHSATRVYDAMVWGVPDAPHGIIDAPLGRSRSDPLRMAVVADGRPSRTDYQVIGSYSEPALVSR